MTVPAIASPAPTVAAATTRAPRPCHTIASWTAVNGSTGQLTDPGARAVHTWCHAEPHTWPTVMEAGPTVTAHVMVRTSTAVSARSVPASAARRRGPAAGGRGAGAACAVRGARVSVTGTPARSAAR